MREICRYHLADEDVVAHARALLGTRIVATDSSGVETVGRIVETEAYRGADDKASHAYPLKRTPRTEVFFGEPGHAYVYLCYGIHRMFNVITGPVGTPNAVLVRAIEPLSGIEAMLKRRELTRVQRRVGGGPGLVCQALGIGLDDNASDLFDGASRVRLSGVFGGHSPKQVIASPRVGIPYAEECAAWPWRFRIAGNGFTSPAR